MLKSLDLRSFLFAWAAALTLISCGKEATPAAPDDAAVEAASPEAAPADTRDGESGDVAYAAIAAVAVADPARSEADRERDESRKPEAMLTFMEVKPGLSVFEIEAGDGYMTELFSRAVGSEGSVVMQNPEQFRDFAGDKIDARLADNRLPNVRASYSTFDALDANDASMDLVTWVWGPHELYYHPESGPGPGNPATAYSEIFRILKPSGAFVVIDHAAAEGSPETTGNDLHRIDPAIVKRMAEQAGFVLEGEGDFLVNPDDPLSVDISVASIRGHTSQFALRFRKPG
ncbi:MAG: class I SAM-dependent methyltransferase [Gammaproteobacteria bacterium]